MSSEPIIDLDVLLAPIPGDSPAGENLLYAGLYDQIREARRSDDTLARGDWEHPVKVSNWREVIKLATGALSTKTKDLQVAAWLAEALIKIHGLAGMRDSLKLMCGMIVNFWDHVYPEVDAGDLDGRANALSFLDRQGAIALKEIPLTRSTVSSNLSYFQWEESKRFDIPEKVESLSLSDQDRVNALKEQAAQEGKATSAQWRTAKNSSHRAFYEETFATLKECTDLYKTLDNAMDEKFKSQTPGLSALRKSFEDVNSLVESVLKEKKLLEPSAVAAGEKVDTGLKTVAPTASGSTASGSTTAMPSTGAAGPILSRQDALNRLAEISEYFRKTEPHSPVAYLVQRAIKWGQMPLDLWLEDVVKDGTVLDHLRETLGIKAATQS
jgi:type VI secretion system protein ImpA